MTFAFTILSALNILLNNLLKKVSINILDAKGM
jgi:hypothetical protein